jgi:hypothetical protein
LGPNGRQKEVLVLSAPSVLKMNPSKISREIVEEKLKLLILSNILALFGAVFKNRKRRTPIFPFVENGPTFLPGNK